MKDVFLFFFVCFLISIFSTSAWGRIKTEIKIVDSNGNTLQTIDPDNNTIKIIDTDHQLKVNAQTKGDSLDVKLPMIWRLCIGGLEFIYCQAEKESGPATMQQVIDKTGKPKTCD